LGGGGTPENGNQLTTMADETWQNYKEEKHSKPSPLKGIRVLEVCTLLLGPAGPGFLAEMGAEVIKCEFPPMGDTCRDLTPFGYLFREQGPAFAHMNTNKYWLGRGMFTPVKDPVYGEVVVAQAQHKMTKTPIRTKWVCQPVGYENETIYKEYMDFSPARLNEMKKTGII
jgi:crotonobetainyl-CoA:carnitine CoA-transferase CaiB-like acyl-CoA transferase